MENHHLCVQYISGRFLLAFFVMQCNSFFFFRADIPKPKLIYGIAHDHGAVWCLEVCNILAL